jgi:hypothetical protein
LEKLRSAAVGTNPTDKAELEKQRVHINTQTKEIAQMKQRIATMEAEAADTKPADKAELAKLGELSLKQRGYIDTQRDEIAQLKIRITTLEAKVAAGIELEKSLRSKVAAQAKLLRDQNAYAEAAENESRKRSRATAPTQPTTTPSAPSSSSSAASNNNSNHDRIVEDSDVGVARAPLSFPAFSFTSSSSSSAPPPAPPTAASSSSAWLSSFIPNPSFTSNQLADPVTEYRRRFEENRRQTDEALARLANFSSGQ